MRTATRVLGLTGALALLAGTAAAQNSGNDTTLNNGGDVVFFYSSPSVGFTTGANPPDVNGDVYWTAHSGADMMNDVEAALGGAFMEVRGFHESLFDTYFGGLGSVGTATSSPEFWSRTVGPANTNGTGGLEPGFVQDGFTTETLVVIGDSGFSSPCSVAPSLCSPTTGSCPPTGFVNGYFTEITLGTTAVPGTGVILPADGTSASDMATAYFVPGGMTASGGPCGLGDYSMNDVHSQDESQADDFGGLNPDGGFQIAGGGYANEAVTSMAEANVTWQGNTLTMTADTGSGLGVESTLGTGSPYGGGALNARRLDVTSGLASLGAWIEDWEAVGTAHLAIVGASLTPLPSPGLPQLGGNLLVLPDGVFNATSGVWQGVVIASSDVGSGGSDAVFDGGEFASVQIPLSSTLPDGVALYSQGAIVDLTTVTLDSTNVARTTLSSL